jgi:hypothetical protein
MNFEIDILCFWKKSKYKNDRYSCQGFKKNNFILIGFFELKDMTKKYQDVYWITLFTFINLNHISASIHIIIS